MSASLRTGAGAGAAGAGFVDASPFLRCFAFGCFFFGPVTMQALTGMKGGDQTYTTPTEFTARARLNS